MIQQQKNLHSAIKQQLQQIRHPATTNNNNIKGRTIHPAIRREKKETTFHHGRTKERISGAQNTTAIDSFVQSLPIRQTHIRYRTLKSDRVPSPSTIPLFSNAKDITIGVAFTFIQLNNTYRAQSHAAQKRGSAECDPTQDPTTTTSTQ